ncbi:rhoptry neck protein 5, putative [Plasmodium berghei]|uniref:Rhoptry neck protein 5, putative n=2 Tax=Plasmodium berghei TaxID=5821 RepID=A0A509AHG8_PLABA|nr:rhoptry neck protein 5, putative [Plasmodium berghei ANKA]CXI25418.1 rhoptry neck protein 5, putative [Plasmodium berghei]SCM20386.1 rhoptry neck protein 5, putative [Plasmodium berghei]SCN23983.1 rhoptry neck protein 5, putative [Plasmodium berghei]SCO59339.1 rhoptry neck protein 5, putative [Plasmodium berghei]SCO60433.1 rhoptry neck protein 5, putative [Plasmodium berghei]|eukprot:XP_034420876.1 rhoptry neck protein 5, putative [Plasmodium berghei ANKA]
MKLSILLYVVAFWYASEIQGKLHDTLVQKNIPLIKNSHKNDSNWGHSNKNTFDNFEKKLLNDSSSINVMFDPRMKKVVPSKMRKQHIVGGFTQNSVDQADVEKGKYETALRFVENMNKKMIILSKEINYALKSEKDNALDGYNRLSSIMKDSLATMYSIDSMKNANIINFSKYNTDWYAKASMKDKYEAARYIQNTIDRLFKPFNKKKNVNEKKINENIKQLETDLLLQRFVMDNSNVSMLLKKYEDNGDKYMVPSYTDVCNQLGHPIISYVFESTYKHCVNNRIDFFKKYFPKLTTKLTKMVENGHIALVDRYFGQSLDDFKNKVSNLMNKKVGFIDMCSKKCFDDTIEINYKLDKYDIHLDPQNTNQRRGDLTRMVLYYYKEIINRIEANADIVLIMLLHLSSSAKTIESGRLDIDITQTTSKQNLINLAIENDKKSKRNFLKIAPFKFFRDPQDKSYSASIFAIDDIMKTCSLSKKFKNYDSLYEKTKGLWDEIQNIYSASYGFVPSKKIKTQSFILSKIRNVGFLFRWLNNNELESNDVNFLVKNYSPLVSLSLQLTFFISTMIEQYESSFLGNFSAAIKKIFTLGKSGTNPKNYDDLISFSETDYLLRTKKADAVQRIINQTIKILKKKFFSGEYTPTLFAQYVSLFLSLWVFEGEKDISMNNPNISRFKKIFFLSFLVHNSGVIEKATEIICKSCQKKTKKIVLGCIDDYGGKTKKKILGIFSRKCKPTIVPIHKKSVRKILKVLMTTLSDPLDILKIAVDLSTRCKYYNDSSSSKKKKHKENYDLFVKSELSLRHTCAVVTRKLVQKSIKRVSRLKDFSEAPSIIEQTLDSVQYLKMRNHRDPNSGFTILCPFMQGTDKHIRDLERSQIISYVLKNVGIYNLFKGKLHNLFSKNINIKEGVRPDSVVTVKVGGRKFNGNLFVGGYNLNVNDIDQNALHIGLSKSRKVYNGTKFVDELNILKEDGIKDIILKGIDNDNERLYVTSTGKKISEFDYAKENPNANIIIFDGNNYISSYALRKIGLENERIVWAGNSVGWAAEFALGNISDRPIPIFDGSAWILLDKLSIKNILGNFLPKNVNGNLLAKDINFIILNKDGKAILKNTMPIVNLKNATFTLNGILNFVIKAEKGNDNEIIVHTRIP